MTMEDTILMLLNARTQLHVWHWQTTSYATHKTLSKLYVQVTEAVDSMTEAWIGVGERPDFKGVTMDDITNYERPATVDEYLKGMVVNLNQLQGVGGDILNMRDDLVGKINTARYLLTLT